MFGRKKTGLFRKKADQNTKKADQNTKNGQIFVNGKALPGSDQERLTQSGALKNLFKKYQLIFETPYGKICGLTLQGYARPDMIIDELREKGYLKVSEDIHLEYWSYKIEPWAAHQVHVGSTTYRGERKELYNFVPDFLCEMDPEQYTVYKVIETEHWLREEALKNLPPSGCLYGCPPAKDLNQKKVLDTCRTEVIRYYE